MFPTERGETWPSKSPISTSSRPPTIDQWITTIREEEALASANHSEAQIDTWEAAGFREEDARNKAKEAKKQYEEALREKFFNF